MGVLGEGDNATARSSRKRRIMRMTPACVPPPATVMHIPHASTIIGDIDRTRICLDDAALDAEVSALTDWYTDELFAVPEFIATAVVYPVSRLVVDPERFIDDAEEPQAAWGMGVVYTRTSTGGPLRARPDDAELRRLLDEHYHPHHARLARAVNESLAVHDRCLVIDCHSFGSTPLPYEPHQSRERPDSCLGTDSWHTPRALLDTASLWFRAAGFTVAVDTPFSGALVPNSHYQRDRRVSALMIEVNKRLYMDERSGERNSAFKDVCGRIQAVVHEVAEFHAAPAIG
jgi:N-formylglutamate deformylase